MNRADELPTPGLRVQFIDKIEDVTDFVKNHLDNDSNKGDMDFLSGRYLYGLVSKITGNNDHQNNPYIEIEIKPFYGGNKYYMFTKKIYKDVRMVGAPPSSIGKFGADTDNWMWPRHTGDFALFRIYADKDGNPTDYSADNVPLRPKKWFEISLAGIKENDYAMIMGFPGSTNRYYSSNEVKSRKDVSNAVRIKVREIRQNVLLDEMLADPQVRIQYASKYAGSSNYYKNSIGMNTAIEKLGVIERKQAEEEVFKNWAAKNGKTQYIDAINNINKATNEIDTLQKQYSYLVEALFGAVEFSRVPVDIDPLKEALNSKNKQLIDSELNKLEAQYKGFANKDYNPMVDKKVADAIFGAYLQDVPTPILFE